MAMWLVYHHLDSPRDGVMVEAETGEEAVRKSGKKRDPNELCECCCEKVWIAEELECGSSH